MERFAHFIEEYLIPALNPYNGVNPNSVVMLDNSSIHHVQSNIENAGCKMIFSTVFARHRHKTLKFP